MTTSAATTYTTASEQETFELGWQFAQSLKPGDAVSLEGDLGTGKTAFAKGVAAGLGVRDSVVSPTFTLVNSYEGRITLHHFDVYRIEDPDELLEIGWEEYLDPGAVCLVEWGDRISDLLPDSIIRVLVTRTCGDTDERQITIERKS